MPAFAGMTGFVFELNPFRHPPRPRPAALAAGEERGAGIPFVFFFNESLC